jgi:hypothetical protein
LSVTGFTNVVPAGPSTHAVPSPPLGAASGVSVRVTLLGSAPVGTDTWKVPSDDVAVPPEAPTTVLTAAGCAGCCETPPEQRARDTTRKPVPATRAAKEERRIPRA